MYHDDSEVTSTAVSDRMIEEANEAMRDIERNNLAFTDADFADMEASAMPLVTVRQHPHWRDVTRPAADALGQVPPESAADLLQLLDDHVGRSDCFHVDTAGRVFVTRAIDGAEATRVGMLVARHLAENCGVASDVTVEMEPTGEADHWRPVLVVGGERRPVGRVLCASAKVAREWAAEYRWGYCTTVVPAEVAVKGEAAAA